ncbi:hypothetical protein Lal_00034645 [Lupinus albus]|nr:hypothetical protein Lal_00034645 [Lupinus albus]
MIMGGFDCMGFSMVFVGMIVSSFALLQDLFMLLEANPRKLILLLLQHVVLGYAFLIKFEEEGIKNSSKAGSLLVQEDHEANDVDFHYLHILIPIS